MRFASAFVFSLVIFAGSAARAFPTGSQFDSDPISSAGGGGINFTGSPMFAAAVCANCHQNGPQTIGIQLQADDATLFTTGYNAGQLYRLRVVLLHESQGLQNNGPARCGDLADGYVPCNINGFALEADDSFGIVAGGLCPSPPSGGTCTRERGAVSIVSMDASAVHTTGYLEKDPAAMLPAGTENGATQWDFYWTAPPGGTGPVTFHIGAVDGNGGEGTTDVPADIYNDDTAEAHIEVAEAGGATFVASTGCGVGRHRNRPFVFGVLGLTLFLFTLAIALRHRHGLARRTR